jgi:hypothetical protein
MTAIIAAVIITTSIITGMITVKPNLWILTAV